MPFVKCLSPTDMSHYLPATVDLLPLRLVLKKLYPGKGLSVVHLNLGDLSVSHVTKTDSSIA